MTSRPVVIAGNRPNVPGSRPVECFGCGRRVWLAPSSVELVADTGAAVLCVADAVKVAEPDDVVAPLTPAQQVEVADYYRRRDVWRAR